MIENIFQLIRENDLQIGFDSIALASIFHDITTLKDYNSNDRRFHHLRSARKARAFMTVNRYSQRMIHEVFQIIEEHGSKMVATTSSSQLFRWADKMASLDIGHTLFTDDGRPFFSESFSPNERAEVLFNRSMRQPQLDKVTFLIAVLFYRADKGKLFNEKLMGILLHDNRILEQRLKEYYENNYSPEMIFMAILNYVDTQIQLETELIKQYIIATMRKLALLHTPQNTKEQRNITELHMQRVSKLIF